MLQLRVPVWVTDMTYLPDHHSIAISTRHKQVSSSQVVTVEDSMPHCLKELEKRKKLI